jgi:hypothetical protein
MMTRAVAFLLFVALFTGCQTAKPIYHWGSYEALTYQDYSSPGKVSPDQQIENLKADLEKAKSANLPAPPGLHAYIGYLYVQSGKADLAAQEFETEKRLFPESAAFIDSLMKRPKLATKP